MPEIVGARSAGASTSIENAASALLTVPSLTLITMFAKVPIWACVGVPESWPVVALKLAQDGWFVIENVSALPSGSLAVGLNE